MCACVNERDVKGVCCGVRRSSSWYQLIPCVCALWSGSVCAVPAARRGAGSIPRARRESVCALIGARGAPRRSAVSSVVSEIPSPKMIPSVRAPCRVREVRLLAIWTWCMVVLERPDLHLGVGSWHFALRPGPSKRSASRARNGFGLRIVSGVTLSHHVTHSLSLTDTVLSCESLPRTFRVQDPRRHSPHARTPIGPKSKAKSSSCVGYSSTCDRGDAAWHCECVHSAPFQHQRVRRSACFRRWCPLRRSPPLLLHPP